MSGTEDYAAANKSHFDKIAHQYDEMPHAIERARRSAEAFRKAYTFDEESTTVMEYACGTGLISRGLAAYSKRIVGIDISQGMVDQYNKRVENQGIPSEEMQAFCVELKGEAGELQDEKFDVIVCASAYHHFSSIDDVTSMLAYFLKPGGSLLVIDILKGHHHPHGLGEHKHNEGHGESHGDPVLFPEGVHHLVPHKGGLGESDLRTAFEGAGLESFKFDDAIDVMRNGHDAKLFIARGSKLQ